MLAHSLLDSSKLSRSDPVARPGVTNWTLAFRCSRLRIRVLAQLKNGPLTLIENYIRSDFYICSSAAQLYRIGVNRLLVFLRKYIKDAV